MLFKKGNPQCAAMAFNRKYTEKELNISNIHLHNLPDRKFQNSKKWNFRNFQNGKKWNFRKFQIV